MTRVESRIITIIVYLSIDKRFIYLFYDIWLQK